MKRRIDYIKDTLQDKNLNKVCFLTIFLNNIEILNNFEKIINENYLQMAFQLSIFLQYMQYTIHQSTANAQSIN